MSKIKDQIEIDRRTEMENLDKTYREIIKIEKELSFLDGFQAGIKKAQELILKK